MIINKKNIEAIRDKLGMTQKELAAAIGLKRYQTILDWADGEYKSNKIKDRYLLKIRDLLIEKESQSNLLNEPSALYGEYADTVDIEFAELRRHLARLELKYKKLKSQLAQYEKQENNANTKP